MAGWRCAPLSSSTYGAALLSGWLTVSRQCEFGPASQLRGKERNVYGPFELQRPSMRVVARVLRLYTAICILIASSGLYPVSSKSSKVNWSMVSTRRLMASRGKSRGVRSSCCRSGST